jgi:hypothetical protein
VTLAAAVGIVLVFRGGIAYGVFGVATWHVALYLASIVPLGLAAALCGLVFFPETWAWARRPRSELLRWAALAFVAGLVLTAAGYVAVAIDALTRDTRFG